ncbi:sulfatase-like hydrolase/transferase [Roseateles sp. DXS20W]|uniref:sulfatase-like hydrolase/transferase n=1 Tax=Pelomonas lactea TaxID=3299030 RepID=UPI0037496244
MPASRPLAHFFSRLTTPRLAALVTLVFALWAVVGTSWFMRHYFGLVTPDQVLFHLQHGGLGEADSRLYARAARCLAGVLGLTALSLFLLGRLRRVHRLPLLGALGVGAVLSVHATVADPCRPEADGGDYLARHYVDPGNVGWQAPAVRPDVLVVFVESLDEAYTHPRAGRAPLLPQLTRLQDDAQTLGRLHNLSGASWTLGGLFSALCGVPLQPVGVISRHAYDYAAHFYAGGHCLTDVLAGQGWQVSFYGGASLKFAGKGRFLQEHGVTRRFGAEQWRAAGVPVPARGWGLLDGGLAEQAWADMQRPRAPGEARASLLLTVDTHGPAGARDPACDAGSVRPADEDEDDVPVELMRGSLRCTDRVVASLVQRFVAQRDGRPKVVWIMGDHLSPAPLLDADLQPAAGGRTVFHALARYDADGRRLPGDDQRREFTHVDVLPTLAEAIGLRWAPQHRLGLGVSLLAEDRSPTLIEREGLAHVDGRLSCRSPLFQRLWLNET